MACCARRRYVCLLWLLVVFAGCQRAPVALPETSVEPSSRATVSTTPIDVRDSKETSVSDVAPRFVVVTPEIGVDFTFDSDVVAGRFFLPEIMGGGLAWIDVDGDGWLDLFAANGCPLNPSATTTAAGTSRLWRNREGEAFVDITTPAQAGVVMFGQGCAVADFDSDGFSDLFIAGYGPDRLLRGQGDGTFRDVTDESGVSGPEWTAGGVWVDLDGDRDLDLYCVNYLNVTLANHQVCQFGERRGYCGPGSYDGVQDQCYLNAGDGTFQNGTDEMGFRAANGKGMSVAAVDLDDDLVPEIYVANDMTANYLFRRVPGGSTTELPRYEDVAASSGCAVGGSGASEASMGISLADFDGDGRTDIYLTHYFHMKNTLYRNLGGLIFDDISNRSRVAATSYESLGFGTAALDYDRDGDPDIFVANGHVLGPAQQPNEMRPQLLNNDKGVFRDVSSSAGTYFKELLLGRCVAACDFDNDGDLDLAVSHIGRPMVLLRNDTPVASQPFVGLTFRTTDRTLPVGGRVVLRTSRRGITYPIVAGGSYMAAQDSRLLLSWPETEELEQIEIHWPSGHIDHLKDVELRRYCEVSEGAASAK